jgi:hypothetical protein
LIIDSTDLPIDRAYIDSIRKVGGVQIISRSKWLNELLVETSDPHAINRINALPFVVGTRDSTTAIIIRRYIFTKANFFTTKDFAVMESQ